MQAEKLANDRVLVVRVVMVGITVLSASWRQELVEKYKRPVFIIGRERGEEATGSARSLW